MDKLCIYQLNDNFAEATKFHKAISQKKKKRKNCTESSV